MKKDIIFRLVIGLLVLVGGIYLFAIGQPAFGFFVTAMGVGIAGNAAVDWYIYRR